MRPGLSALLLALPVLAAPQAQTTLNSAGGQYTIHAGSYTGSAATLGGSADFFANGVAGDYAFRDMWAYRIQGDTREYMVKSAGATFGGGGNTFTAQMFKGQHGSDSGAMVQLDVTYSLGALSSTQPALTKCLQVTNLTGSNLDVSIFHYMDYDIPTGFTNDTFSFSGFNGSTADVEQRNVLTPGNFMYTTFTGVGGPVSYRFDPTFDSLFTNPVLDNLNFSVFPGVGDLAVGFQVDFTLAPGQQSVCPGCVTVLNGVVPEPGSLIVLGTSSLLAVWCSKRASRRKSC